MNHALISLTALYTDFSILGDVVIKENRNFSYVWDTAENVM